MTLRKGITIVEVIISFTIAIILIMALYMIVYWGTDINTINNKITKINNVMTFIQQDMLNNTPLYFELLQDSSMTYKTNINNIIQTRLEQFKLNDPIIRNIKLLNFQRERKPGIIAGNFENIYRVTIEVEWEHKGNIKKYKTDFLISSYSLKKITSGQPINDTDLSVNLPDNYYAPIMTALVTPPPPPHLLLHKQQLLNKQPLNKQLLNKQPLNKQPLNKQLLNKQLLNKQLLNKQLLQPKEAVEAVVAEEDVLKKEHLS